MTKLTLPQLERNEVDTTARPVPELREQKQIAESMDALEGGLREEVPHVDALRLLQGALGDDLLTGRVRVTPLLENSSE